MANPYKHVNFNETRIAQPLPEGYYACTERDGDITIRNLKEESLEYMDDRDKFWGDTNKDQYPYSLHYNFQYMEMYHWGESPKYGCDYERDGCFLKPDDVVVDIGANVGIFTRLAHERGAKHVFAFEPSFDAYKCLLLNTHHTNTSPYKACIHNFSGFTDINITSSTYPMAEVVRTESKLESVENVSCYTLDDLMDHEILPSKIDFMKIDIEGNEVELFEGLSDSNLANIDRLSLEAHFAPTSVPNRNDEVTAVLERLCCSFSSSYQMSYNPDGNKDRFWTRTINLWK